VVLDLGEQDFLKRGVNTKAVFSRPLTLLVLIISARKEGIGIAVEHWFQQMKRSETIVQEQLTALVESDLFRPKPVQARKVGWRKRAVLKELHGL
jgi:hypothetical protein